MVNEIYQYVLKNEMLKKGDRVVAGVSGGADSICLLHVLKELKERLTLTIHVVHVNHGIRGAEAKRDETFVEDICKEWGIPYHVFSFDIPAVAKEHGISEEEAGRNIRYDTFRQVCIKNQCNKIAIAHNRNDNGETVLFHLIRGTGIKGLAGIDGVRTINQGSVSIEIIRPLLNTERAQIEKYLKERQIPYQIDGSNETNDYSRNRIRNQIFPLLVNEINANALGNIVNAAGQLREIDHFITKCIRQSYEALVSQQDGSYLVGVEALVKEDIVVQKGLIREIIMNIAGHLKDIESKHIQMILDLVNKSVGKYVNLPYGMIGMREYDKIKLFLADKNNKIYQELETKPYYQLKLPNDEISLAHNVKLLVSALEHTNNQAIPKNSCTKWFDYDRIENAVVVRTREEGDYIQINSKGGNKKLKDYFIDQKIPKEERSKQLLVADGKHIMWVLGDSRISEKYKIHETTKNILSMKLIKVEDETDE